MLRPDLRGRTPTARRSSTCRWRSTPTRTRTPCRPVVVAAITQAVAEVAAGLNRYPDREFTALREGLAAYLSRSGTTVAAEQVWAGNGSNEVLLHLLQAFGGPGRTALGFTPAYSMHPIITTTPARRGSTGCAACPAGERSTSTRHPPSTQVRRHRPDVVFLCSPNNPTGTALDLDVVVAVHDARRGRAGRRRRGVRRVRPAGHAERADPARGAAAARRDPHDEQGVRAGRWPAGLPRRRPRARRRAAPGADAVPPLDPDPGGRARRARRTPT